MTSAESRRSGRSTWHASATNRPRFGRGAYDHYLEKTGERTSSTWKCSARTALNRCCCRIGWRAARSIWSPRLSTSIARSSPAFPRTGRMSFQPDEQRTIRRAGPSARILRTTAEPSSGATRGPNGRYRSCLTRQYIGSTSRSTTLANIVFRTHRLKLHKWQ